MRLENHMVTSELRCGVFSIPWHHCERRNKHTLLRAHTLSLSLHNDAQGLLRSSRFWVVLLSLAISLLPCLNDERWGNKNAIVTIPNSTFRRLYQTHRIVDDEYNSFGKLAQGIVD
jgi:hypothetical protein